MMEPNLSDFFTVIRTAKVYLYHNEVEITPDRSLKLRNHSPDGFEYGYGGSGPSQLALAIMLECVSEEDALRYYQDFKQVCIAREKGAEFTIFKHQVVNFVASLKEITK